MSHVAFVTSAALSNLTEDDRIAAEALTRKGATVTPVVWTEPQPLNRFDAIVIRSPWDYTQRAPEFAAWLGEACRAPLFNPYDVIRWNVDKRYLLELGARGASVIPTRVLDHGTHAALGAVLREEAWDRAVVKPLISAGGRRTFSTTAEAADAAQADLDQLLNDGGVLIQPFAEGVTEEGEWSLIYINGVYSHCVLKRSPPNDFRVHTLWGGTVAAAQPSPEVLEAAERTLAVLDTDLLYARVDLVRCNGVYSVMELELIEPELFFRFDPASGDRFADALLGRINERLPGLSTLGGARGAMAG